MFGENYQHANDPIRTTNSGTTFVTKLSLSIPAGLTGKHRVAWHAVVDAGATGQVESMCSVDGAGSVGAVMRSKTQSTLENVEVGGFVEMEYGGNAHLLEIKFRALSGIAGLADARIEAWKVE